MGPKHSRTDHLEDDPAPPKRDPALGSALPCCGLQLTSPPDRLTQLLMMADGVTEADLNALLRKVVLARAGG